MDSEASTSFPEDPSQIIDRLTRLQELAARIRDERRSLVELDRRRQKLREGLRALEKRKEQERTMICMGPHCFIAFPQTEADRIIREDMQNIDKLTDEVNISLKRDVDALLRMEGDKDLADRGFDLKNILEEAKLK